MYRTVKQVSVRAGFDLDSEKVGTVAGGKVLEVLEEEKDAIMGKSNTNTQTWRKGGRAFLRPVACSITGVRC